MTRFIRGIIHIMSRKLSKTSPKPPEEVKAQIEPIQPPMGQSAEVEKQDVRQHPQDLFNHLLEQHNLQVDFDVIPEKTPVKTEFGIIKLEKATLVLKASYVQR